MTITASPLTQGVVHTQAASYGTNVISPTAGRVVLVSVWGEGTSGPYNIPTLVGCNMTWTQIRSVQGNQGDLTMFIGFASNPTPGSVSILFGGQNQFNCAWLIDEVVVDTSGVNAANAIVQSGQATNNTPPATGSLTINLATLQSLFNAGYGVVGLKDGRAISFNSPYTQVNIINDGSDIQLRTVFGLNTSNNANFLQFTWSSVEANNRALAVELKAGPDGGIFLMNFL